MALFVADDDRHNTWLRKILDFCLTGLNVVDEGGWLT
jgi:hypothetical protein